MVFPATLLREALSTRSVPLFSFNPLPCFTGARDVSMYS
jgi:hypothetical protein